MKSLNSKTIVAVLGLAGSCAAFAAGLGGNVGGSVGGSVGGAAAGVGGSAGAGIDRGTGASIDAGTDVGTPPASASGQVNGNGTLSTDRETGQARAAARRSSEGAAHEKATDNIGKHAPKASARQKTDDEVNVGK